jgi:hypothetical protein
MIVDSAINKKKINNTHYWAIIYETLRQFDSDADHPLKGKFTAKIDELVKRHYTEDRRWRYNLENGGSWYTLEEMQNKREDSDLSKFVITRAEVD